MQATTDGTLAETPVEWPADSACCLILASRGYPAAYEKGYPITMTEEARAHAYIAGAKLEGRVLKTSGGRVLGLTAVAPTLREAVDGAYRLAESVEFENKYHRGDIGARALAALEG